MLQSTMHVGPTYGTLGARPMPMVDASITYRDVTSAFRRPKWSAMRPKSKPPTGRMTPVSPKVSHAMVVELWKKTVAMWSDRKA